MTYDTLFIILLIMLYISAIIDWIALVNILALHNENAVEYTQNGLKWFKIILVFFLGAAMLFYSFTVANSTLITIAEFVLGLLLVADGVCSIVVKLKYGKMK